MDATTNTTSPDLSRGSVYERLSKALKDERTDKMVEYILGQAETYFGQGDMERCLEALVAIDY